MVVSLLWMENLHFTTSLRSNHEERRRSPSRYVQQTPKRQTFRNRSSSSHLLRMLVARSQFLVGRWFLDFWGRGSKLCSLLYLAEKNCRENRRSRGKLGSLHLSHKRSAGLYFVVHTTKLMISRNFPPSISNFGRVPFSRKLIHLPISSRIISRFDGSIKWWTIFLRRFKRSAVAEDIASNSRVSFTLCANLQFV